MNNHYPLVLRINKDEAQRWDTNTVIERWYRLFKGNLLVDRYLSRDVLNQAEIKAINDCANEWRKRLMSISWYMRCLNEAIARETNTEDNCTGHFWEGRFKLHNPELGIITLNAATSLITLVQTGVFLMTISMRKDQE